MEALNIFDTVGALHDAVKYAFTGESKRGPLTTEEKDNKILYDIIKNYGNRSHKISYELNRFVNGDWGTHDRSQLLAKFWKVYKQATHDKRVVIKQKLRGLSQNFRNRINKQLDQQHSHEKTAQQHSNKQGTHHTTHRARNLRHTKHTGKHNAYSKQPASSLRF